MLHGHEYGINYNADGDEQIHKWVHNKQVN